MLFLGSRSLFFETCLVLLSVQSIALARPQGSSQGPCPVDALIENPAESEDPLEAKNRELRQAVRPHVEAFVDSLRRARAGEIESLIEAFDKEHGLGLAIDMEGLWRDFDDLNLGMLSSFQAAPTMAMQVSAILSTVMSQTMANTPKVAEAIASKAKDLAASVTGKGAKEKKAPKGEVSGRTTAEIAADFSNLYADLASGSNVVGGNEPQRSGLGAWGAKALGYGLGVPLLSGVISKFTGEVAGPRSNPMDDVKTMRDNVAALASVMNSTLPEYSAKLRKWRIAAAGVGEHADRLRAFAEEFEAASQREGQGSLVGDLVAGFAHEKGRISMATRNYENGLLTAVALGGMISQEVGRQGQEIVSASQGNIANLGIAAIGFQVASLAASADRVNSSLRAGASKATLLTAQMIERTSAERRKRELEGPRDTATITDAMKILRDTAEANDRHRRELPSVQRAQLQELGQENAFLGRVLGEIPTLSVSKDGSVAPNGISGSSRLELEDNRDAHKE